MANLLENLETIQQQIRLFDDVRPNGARMFLLKKKANSGKYLSVAEITFGWFASFDKQFRDELKVSIATLDPGLQDKVAQSSFLAYGSGDTFDVYKFEKKDATSPNATSPSWKIYATRLEAERFSPPVFVDGGIIFDIE